MTVHRSQSCGVGSSGLPIPQSNFPMKRATYHQFPLRSPERNTVRLARIATCNTVMGGASALVIAKVADRLGVQFVDGASGREIVSDVYSRSTGRESVEFGGWECPECGCAHCGRENALRCCAVDECED